MPPGAIVTVEQLENGNFSHYSVCADVYIYGSASSPDVAADLSNQINGIWNNSFPSSPTTSRFSYQEGSPVEFNISFIHVSIDEAKALADGNTDKSVNFLKIVSDESTNSFFEGNSGVLNLLQNSERGFTTGAHEIGHMMGFSSQYTDNTHLTDEFMQEGFNGTIPIMYSGGTFTNQLDQRVRTSADVQGLNIWNAVWEGNGYIGESINNKIHE